MKAYVLKHAVCAPNDITVLPPANQSTCAKEHRVCQPLGLAHTVCISTCALTADKRMCLKHIVCAPLFIVNVKHVCFFLDRIGSISVCYLQRSASFANRIDSTSNYLT